MLRNHKSGDPAAAGLAALLGVEAHGAEYFIILGVIASRFHRLEEFVLKIVTDDSRNTILRSLPRLRAFLSLPAKPNGSWDQVKESLFPEAAMNVLSMLSPLLAEKAPLSVPTAAERADAIQKIDAALEALAEEHDALSAALHGSLSATRRMMEKFEFWGPESLTQQLQNIVGLYELTVRRDPDRRTSAAMLKVVAALSFLLSINVGADAALTALENNYTRATTILGYAGELLGGLSSGWPPIRVELPTTAVVPRLPSPERRTEEPT
jgi:hypothetical protein